MLAVIFVTIIIISVRYNKGIYYKIARIDPEIAMSIIAENLTYIHAGDAVWESGAQGYQPEDR